MFFSTLGHKTSLNKFKKIETISSTFSDHNGVKLEINYRKKMEPPPKYVEIKHASKKPNGSRRKQEIKDYCETNENVNTTLQNLRNTVKAVIRGKFTATQDCLKRQEKSQVNNLNLYLKKLEKINKQNPKQKEGNKKDQSRKK